MIRNLTFVLLFLILSVVSSTNTDAQTVEPVVSDSQEALTEPAAILPPEAVLLGQMEENGVIAMAWKYRVPVSAVSAEQGKQYPYLLFLRFLSVENNVLIEKGLVAYKLKGNDDFLTPARKMEFKSGYFVAGLNSPGAKTSLLLVGCKLEDDKKRQFQYPLNLN